MLNRTQALVLTFVILAWVSLLVLFVATPDVYERAMRLPDGVHGVAGTGILVMITALVGVLGAGVVRRWRWTFWLILVAFLAGVLRVPASVLELLGLLPTTGPTWYVLFQAGVGLLQFGIGLAMVAAYRRAGVWGRSDLPARRRP